MTHRHRLHATYLALSLPALLYLGLQLPLLGSAAHTALTDESGALTLEHVRRVFADPLVVSAVVNNTLLPLFSVALEAAVGLVMALWFYRIRRGKTLWRTVAIVPFAVPEIVYLLTMKLIFREHGYLNSLALGAGVLDHLPGWLTPGTALLFVVMVLVDAWRVTPLVFLIVLSALEQLDESVLEAATVDGARTLQVVRFIQVPLALPALAVAIALRAVDAFRIFATPLVLVGVQGFPVLTSVAYHYQADLHDAPAANVVALALGCGLAVAALVGFALARRRERIV